MWQRTLEASWGWCENVSAKLGRRRRVRFEHRNTVKSSGSGFLMSLKSFHLSGVFWAVNKRKDRLKSWLESLILKEFLRKFWKAQESFYNFEISFVLSKHKRPSLKCVCQKKSVSSRSIKEIQLNRTLLAILLHSLANHSDQLLNNNKSDSKQTILLWQNLPQQVFVRMLIKTAFHFQ